MFWFIGILAVLFLSVEITPRAYHEWLHSQVEEYKPLPPEFVARYQRFFRIDLNKIKIATGLDIIDYVSELKKGSKTERKGNNMTFGYEIYLSQKTLAKTGDHLMLHEIAHAQQYEDYPLFLEEYMSQSVAIYIGSEDKTLSKIHKKLPFEQEADEIADYVCGMTYCKYYPTLREDNEQ